MTRENRKLLITGCARSGTLFASRLWQALGLDVTHERPVAPDGRMGTDGIASWFMTANDPNPPYGPSILDYKFDVIIHQVRDPLKVIPSTAQFIIRANMRGKKYIVNNCPQINLNPVQQRYGQHEQWILQAALYWHHWNLMAEKIATVTVSLDQLPNKLHELCDLVNVKYMPAVFNSIPKDINSRKRYIKDEPWVLDWSMLESIDTELCNKIQIQAKRYECYSP